MKNKKIIIIAALCAIFIGSVGYIGYKKIGEPTIKDSKYEDLREAHDSGDLKFNAEKKTPRDNSSITDDSSSIAPKKPADKPETSSDKDEEKGYNGNNGDDGVYTYEYTYEDRMIGWISIPGTSIDYPVMYYENDNSYYLTHDYQNRYDSYGSVFLDGSQWVGAKNMTLFGHNINSYYHSMFKEILNFENQSFLDSHPIVNFDIGSGSDEWEVIGCLIVNVDEASYSYNRCEFADDDDFIGFANHLLENCTAKKEGVEISGSDQLLTLSTCSYHYKNCRTVLICRKQGETSNE